MDPRKDRYVRLRPGATAFAASLPAVAAAQPCWDLNMDCVVNGQDYAALLDYIESHGIDDPKHVPFTADGYDPLFDLLLDGDVNAVDLSLLAGEVSSVGPYACGDFAFRWSVRDNRVISDLCTDGPGFIGWEMDKSISFGAVPILRDTFEYVGSKFGNFPKPGLHLMFWDASAGYAGWASRYETWLSDPAGGTGVRERLQSQICDLMDDALDQPGDLFVMIDYEGWFFTWEETLGFSVPAPPPDLPDADDQDWAHDWRDMIRAIHGSTWDPAFLDRFGIPAFPYSGYLELRQQDPALADEFLRVSWESVARDFAVYTLEAAREVVAGRAASVHWGYGRWPLRWLLKDGYNDTWNPDAQAKRDKNDSIAWLWQAQDLYCPYLYITSPTCEPGQVPVIDGCSPAWANRAYVMSVIEEAIRLRDTYNPDAYIIPWMSHTREIEGLPDLSELDIQAGFGIARRAGADGVAVWRPINNLVEQIKLQAKIWLTIGVPGPIGQVMMDVTCEN